MIIIISKGIINLGRTTSGQWAFLIPKTIAVEKVVEGLVAHEFSASIIQDHRSANLFLEQVSKRLMSNW